MELACANLPSQSLSHPMNDRERWPGPPPVCRIRSCGAGVRVGSVGEEAVTGGLDGHPPPEGRAKTVLENGYLVCSRG